MDSAEAVKVICDHADRDPDLAHALVVTFDRLAAGRAGIICSLMDDIEWLRNARSPGEAP